MMRGRQWIVLAITGCAYAVGQAADSEIKVPSPPSKVSRQLVEQKEAFLKRVLSDSPAAKRIEASRNAEARKHLAGAQESYTKAVLSIRKNDFAAADRQLNEATWLIGKARQLVPDPLTRGVEHRARYAQMLESVESLRLSYHRHLQRVKEQDSGVAASDAQLVKVARLVDTAKSLASSEQIAQANKTLDEAEQVLMVGLSRVLGTKIIKYALRFETPAEEFAYELERNRSYADLIPIALAAFNPGSQSIREVQHFVDINRRLHEQAQQHSGKKDYRAALKALRDGTAQLQNALAAAGLRVPQDPKPE